MDGWMDGSARHDGGDDHDHDDDDGMPYLGMDFDWNARSIVCGANDGR